MVCRNPQERQNKQVSMTERVEPQIKNFLLYLLLLLVGIIAIILLFSKEAGSKDEETNKEATGSAQTGKISPPPMIIDKNKKYKAQITTSKGKFTIELFTKETPATVNNFVALSKKGFYNNTVFHRVIKDFMIQGGDPRGDGSGGPGYTFADEKITRNYKRGILAMANRGPDTNGSQFFIIHKDYDLPKNYVIFGQVTSGMETIDKIAEVKVEDNGRGETSKPAEVIKIEKVVISEE